MSADNWTICPRCKADAEKASVEAKLKAGEAYGKVTPEKYLAMLKDANSDPQLVETLREDYHMTMEDGGTFTVEYSCSCENCRFTFNFKHEEKAKL